MIEVIPVGGYSEVGKNMTAIKIDDEILILDMGLYLPAVLSYEEGDPHNLEQQANTIPYLELKFHHQS